MGFFSRGGNFPKTKARKMGKLPPQENFHVYTSALMVHVIHEHVDNLSLDQIMTTRADVFVKQKCPQLQQSPKQPFNF